jgi:hypothetical protein
MTSSFAGVNRGQHGAIKDVDDFKPSAPENNGHRILVASPFAPAFNLRNGGNGVFGHRGDFSLFGIKIGNGSGGQPSEMA